MPGKYANPEQKELLSDINYHKGRAQSSIGWIGACSFFGGLLFSDIVYSMGDGNYAAAITSSALMSITAMAIYLNGKAVREHSREYCNSLIGLEKLILVDNEGATKKWQQ